MDLPQEPAIVHEYFMETEEETSAEKNLKIADLSFGSPKQVMPSFCCNHK